MTSATRTCLHHDLNSLHRPQLHMQRQDHHHDHRYPTAKSTATTSNFCCFLISDLVLLTLVPLTALPLLTCAAAPALCTDLASSTSTASATFMQQLYQHSLSPVLPFLGLWQSQSLVRSFLLARMGVIDFLVHWDVRKKTESAFKRTCFHPRHRERVTITDPDTYKRRQMAFLKAMFQPPN